MKNKIIVLLIVLISITTVLLNTKIKQKGIIYALSLDGEQVNNFPSPGLYRVDVSCSGGSAKWNYELWQLDVLTLNEILSCNISFNTIGKILFNNYIINLNGKSQGTGQVVNENGYRYEGRNPNNYVWFNNELWRIIGVFGSESHGQTGENLVKIIRAYSIDSLAWDNKGTYGENNWSTSSLKSLLNGAYYNAQDGTDSGYCSGYVSSLNLTANCDYRIIGIQDSYRTMIKKVTWYLGGISTGDATTEDFYGYERGETVYDTNSTSVQSHIGLMYASDYGYSVLSSSCARTTNFSSYSFSPCAGYSWLYGQGFEWTLTPNSSNSRGVFYLYEDGNLNTSFSGYAFHGYAVRPTLYLDSSVYVMDGNGSMLDPYIITMDAPTTE